MPTLLTDADKVLRNDVGKRMATALEAIAQGGGGGASVVQKTMAEYTALPSSEKMNGSIYKITDKALIYCLDEEYHALKEITSADYAQLTSAEQNNGTIYVKTDEETTADDIPYSAGVSVADKIDELTTYSTNERVVGEWIDGKPVYEKIIDVPMPSTANTMENTPHNIANIDTLVSYFAFDVYPNGTIVPMPTYLWTTGGQSASFYASLDKTNINILCGADRTGHIGRFFIRYTKTTD